MPVYFIASYDIKDSKTYGDYIVAADAVLNRHGGKILVADEDAKVLEGQSRMVNVIVQFESETSAMNFYLDPEYQSAKQLRLNATQNGGLVLVRQLPGL